MREIYNLIFSLPPKQFTIIAFLLGILLVDDLNATEQNALGGFFELVGQVLITNAAQSQLIQNIVTNNQNNRIIHDLEIIKNMLNIEF